MEKEMFDVLIAEAKKALVGVGFLFVCAFYNITGATLLAVFLIALVNLFVCDLLWRSVDDD